MDVFDTSENFINNYFNQNVFRVNNALNGNNRELSLQGFTSWSRGLQRFCDELEITTGLNFDISFSRITKMKKTSDPPLIIDCSENMMTIRDSILFRNMVRSISLIEGSQNNFSVKLEDPSSEPFNILRDQYTVINISEMVLLILLSIGYLLEIQLE